MIQPFEATTNVLQLLKVNLKFYFAAFTAKIQMALKGDFHLCLTEKCFKRNFLKKRSLWVDSHLCQVLKSVFHREMFQTVYLRKIHSCLKGHGPL